MTSLQRSLQSSARDSPKYATSNGTFESCFADGLDLSEFSSSTKAAGKQKQKSAAAELLQLKQAELKKQQEDEAMEKQMEGVILKKAHSVQKSIARRKDGTENVLVNALVKMHNGDQVSVSRKVNRKAQRNAKSPIMNGLKRQAHKKQRKSKY